MKKLLLGLCTLLMAGIASAQCNPTFTVTSTNNPSGNSLLRAAVVNTSALGLPAGRYAEYWYGGSAAAQTGSSSPGNTTYLSFSAPGTYAVSLQVMVRDSLAGNAIVCRDSVFQNITVGYTPCGTQLTYSVGTTGSYAFAAINPAGTTGMTYSWNFGDGTTGTGANLNHTYPANGMYNVSLTASNGSCTYANSATVIVSNIPVNCANNHASFTSSISNNLATFNNTTPAAPAYTDVTSWWDFGDGSAYYFYNPTVTHGYAAVGTYNVMLVSVWGDSTSNTSCRDTARSTITISNIPALPSYINGYVSRNNLAASSLNDSIRVWLIKYDSTAHTLTAVDSTWTDSAAVTAYAYLNTFHFNNVAAGAYLMKAARVGGTVGLNGPIPTYSDSSLYWSTAVTYNVIAGNTYYAGIGMRHGVVSSGPGFIGGNVSLGANRGTGAGLAGMNILLRNSVSGAVLRAVLTDVNGDFSFSNLPTGLYSVYPEEAGYATTARSSIAITNAQNNVTAINFMESRSNKTITPGTLNVSTINANGATVNLFPNPAKGTVTLSWKGFDGKSLEVSIANVTGQLVHVQSTGSTATGTTAIDISRLAAGIYTVRIHSNMGDAVQKLVVQP